MKPINYVIFAYLLSFVLLLHGPYYDQQNRYDYIENCAYRFIGASDSASPTIEEHDNIPYSKSDCVDRNLFNPLMSGNKYYDHCCYVRMQQEGNMYQGCIGLKEIDYLDIDETIFKIEKGIYKYWQTSTLDYYLQTNGGWPYTKVYSMECNSSFIYISVAVIISLLGLML